MLVAACANATIPTTSPTIGTSPTQAPTSSASTPTFVLAVPTATSVPATSLLVQPTPAGRSVGLKPGFNLPNFTFAGVDGKPITGADLTAQRKPYILFFFATW